MNFERKIRKEQTEEAEIVITPDTALAEVARKHMREEVKEGVTRRRLSIILEVSETPRKFPIHRGRRAYTPRPGSDPGGYLCICNICNLCNMAF